MEITKSESLILPFYESAIKPTNFQMFECSGHNNIITDASKKITLDLKQGILTIGHLDAKTYKLYIGPDHHQIQVKVIQGSYWE